MARSQLIWCSCCWWLKILVHEHWGVVRRWGLGSIPLWPPENIVSYVKQKYSLVYFWPITQILGATDLSKVPRAHEPKDHHATGDAAGADLTVSFIFSLDVEFRKRCFASSGNQQKKTRHLYPYRAMSAAGNKTICLVIACCCTMEPS